ncbi:MAG TPA: translation elongation factor 4 [Planctomycetota bacterium]|nr:translation elongation factor 4 [Planctomycetota bacterium]
MPQETIRNFCIIAHIDHGKSTLADRLLLHTGTVAARDFQDQVLDDMDLERERGITIKAKAVSLRFTTRGTDYLLNLIDTPGHVDFSYEVSRSLAACEGALLLVDASQGVEAQTIANAHLALEANLVIVPVLNKVDMAAARPDEVIEEMVHALGIDPGHVHRVSAKTGFGVPELLEIIVDRVPAPSGRPDAALRALIFDAVYDEYRGVIVYVRMVDGALRPGQHILMMGAGRTFEVEEVGIFGPKMEKLPELRAGEVGYLTATIKTLSDVKIGDTITTRSNPAVEKLQGYKEPLPMVYCGLYPTSNTDFERLRQALDKLRLNDSSFTYAPESSGALGFGFRCGFLGLLHMEVVQERLERESGVDIVQTAPNVTFEILLQNNDVIRIESPTQLPDPSQIVEICEPLVKATVMIPAQYIGNIMTLMESRRAKYMRTDYLSQARVILEYEMPLAELISDFHDKLKSSTRGYGTLDYEFIGYAAADLVKLNILVNGAPLDALSVICHKDIAEQRGRKLLRKLKDEIPRHLFEVPLQAAIGGKIIARESIKALRKNVTAKCYGGDITRKRKLLERQKEGKKRMKHVGNVEIPQDAFLAVLRLEDEN